MNPEETDDDVCGLCGELGANKIPHPVFWPGEARPDTPFVHAECEAAECAKAHAGLSLEQIRAFLESL